MMGILDITDGTTRINLLTGIDGFRLNAWTPTIPPTKQVWHESPLSDGRKLAMSKWANATETFGLTVTRFTQDDIITDLQNLRRLLLAAREYFTGGSDTPVWIEARGDCETNTRYAPICDWRAEADGDPYHKPFDLDNPAIGNFTLVLERQHWRHLAPGSSECVELSATQDYYIERAVNFNPGQSGDDCYVDTVGGTITLNGNIRFGRTAGSAAIYGVGIRFTNVTIPNGSNIVSALVAFKADATLANDDVNIVIAADDADNSAVFSTYANFTGRTRTTAHVHWSAIAHWTQDVWYYTANISTVVQEIVNRGGWASGNNLSILFDDDTSTANATRTAYSWDTGAPASDPILHITWFDSTTKSFGQTATCDNTVYVANKHNVAQLTHILYDDGGAFSTNLIGAALPFAFLPAVPAVNDAVYFGIDTSVTDSGPFCSLVFDIGTAQVDCTTVVWHYWNGAWTAIPDYRDNTNTNGAGTGDPFDTTGVNSVHWEVPSDWITTSVDGITGYWVVAIVDAVGAAPAPPTQQNRDIYTVVTPFIDTVTSEIEGDIPALARLIMEGQSGLLTQIHGPTTIYAGLRSYSRGSDFTNFINLADEQNDTSIYINVNGASATLVTDVTAPSGRCIDWTTAGAAAEEWLVYATLGPNIITHYVGKFRCFLRLIVHNLNGTDMKLRLKITEGAYTNTIYQTGQKNPIGGSSTHIELIDFGVITLPPIHYESGDTFHQVDLRIDGQALAAIHAHLFDIVLMPIDECFIESKAIPPPDALVAWTINNEAKLIYDMGEWRCIDMDSTIPRIVIRTPLVLTTGPVITSWSHSISGPLIWQPNEHQRWWFLQGDINPGSSISPDKTLSLRGWKVSRYLSMRGKR